MDVVDIARWQFGITTVYHFLMVPLTIGLGLVVAAMQTMWVRTGHEQYLRMTKFFGKLFLINFIMGVATGIVQEFQFGLAWSEYSRFVGDVFGAPLAMEALLAFFLESTFLGLWIFGWDRLPKKLHLATLWLAVIGSAISAYFIIVANSFMQHPVGIEFVETESGIGRARMVDAWAVFTNNTALVAFSHVIPSAIMVAGAFLFGIAWYHLWRRRKSGIDTVDENGKVVVGSDPSLPGRDETDHKVWLTSLRWGGWITIVAMVFVSITGDMQAKLMFEQQPLKMASAEALCSNGTDFSVLTLGSPGASNCGEVHTLIEVPGLLSFLAKGDFHTPVPGIEQLIPEYKERYGTNLPDLEVLGDRAGHEINYQPEMAVTYWGFRIMITGGAAAAMIAAVGLWLTRKGTVPQAKWLMWGAAATIGLPFLGNSAGWIFTEMGRQPFVVAPNPDPSGVDQVWLFTAAAVSPGVHIGEVIFSTIGLTLVYAILAVVEVYLLVKYIRGGVASAMPQLGHSQDSDHDSDDPDKKDDVLSFAY